MTLSRANIRRELYNQVPGLGFSGTADSLTGATLTDTFVFNDTTLPSGHYRGMYLYRPDRTTDDRIKRIVSHVPSTGVVTVASSYSNTSDLNYEVVGLLHPDELNACITRAMQRIFFETQLPLCGEITDGDMEAANTSSWTASAGSLVMAKSSTATNVFTGTYSLRLTNGAANQYAYSNNIRVLGNEPFFASAVVRADVGTASLTVYDVTNSAIIYRAVTTSQELWQNLFVVSSIPSTCEEIQLQLGGTESNADCYWNHALFYRTQQTFLPAPSWVDEQHKLLKIRQCMYLAAKDTDTHDATSRTYDDWLQPSMFSLDPFRLETNPYMIQFKRRLPNHELWVEGKRPYSDVEPLTTTDSDTTHAPPRLIYAYARQELVQVLRRRYPSDQRWARMVEESSREVDAETVSRPETPLQPGRREEWVGYV